MTTTIAIACHAGGVGKTTTTLALAGMLSQTPVDVLTIDMDPQASLTRTTESDLRPRGNDVITTDALLTGRMHLLDSLAHEVTEVTTARDDGAWGVIPASMRLQETAAWMQLQTITHDHLSDALDDVDEWDAILIDCPPAADLLTINALCAADYVIVPVIPEPKGLDGLSRMIELVYWLNSKRVSHARILGMVITQMDSRTKGHQAGVLDLQRTGVPVLAEIPMAKGQDADAKLRHAYQPLVTAVLDRIQEARHA